MEPSLFLSPAQTVAAYAQAGADKTRRSACSLLLLGALAGALIALAAAASNHRRLWNRGPLDPSDGVRPAVPLRPGYGHSHGGGAVHRQLPHLRLPAGPAVLSGGMLRNWGLVYAGNAVGAVLVAFACAYFGQMDYSGGLLGAYTIKVAAGKCALAAPNAFVLGILCNLLVCLGGADGHVRRTTPAAFWGLSAGVLLRPVRL